MSIQNALKYFAFSRLRLSSVSYFAHPKYTLRFSAKNLATWVSNSERVWTNSCNTDLPFIYSIDSVLDLQMLSMRTVIQNDLHEDSEESIEDGEEYDSENSDELDSEDSEQYEN